MDGLEPQQPVAAPRDTLYGGDLDEDAGVLSYEGRGWLSGAAGRLAAERRKVTRSDAELVAAAAQDARELRELQAASPARSAAGREGPQGSAAHSSGPQQDVEILDRDFHAAIREADAEPLLVADCGLVLEATLGVDDLDGLIARLRAGVVDLGPGPPPDSPAGANATAGVGGTGGVSDAQAAAAGRGWFTDLPAADTLWSDEEEDQVSAARLVLQDKALGVPSSAPEIGAAAASRAPEGISSVSSGIRRDAPIAAAGTITSAPTVAMPELPGQTISAPGGLTGPLPAKFKFFAGPTPALGQPGGLAPPRQAGSDSSSGTGPVKVDLRASIADVVEQRHKETAAAAAERVSREKASAAARRLRGSSDGDSDDDEGGEPAQPKQRPVPPAAKALTSSTSLLAPQAVAANSAPHSVSKDQTQPPAPPSAAPDAVASVSADAGTDCSDLPGRTSRSVFVSTSDPMDDEERLRDIKEYLRVRAQRTAAEAAAAAAGSSPAGQDRKWPSPPKTVAERIAGLEQKAAAAAAAAANGAPGRGGAAAVDAVAAPGEKRAKQVATFGGGGEVPSGRPNTHRVRFSDSDTRVDADVVPGPQRDTAEPPPVAAAAAPPSSQAAAAPGPAAAPATSHAAPSVQLHSMQCSTEGDEDLLAEPAPASVVHASQERGSRAVAVGSFISAGFASAASAPVPQRPAAMNSTPAPTTTIAPAPIHPPLSPTSASAAAISPVPSLLTSPAQGAGLKSPSCRSTPSAISFSRLPTWLPPSTGFTLLLTSPQNLHSMELGSVVQWLLRLSASSSLNGTQNGTASAHSAAPPGLPAFSIVSLRLLCVCPSWPLLSPVASAYHQATAAGSPGATRAGASTAGTGAAGAKDEPECVRVLAVACTPTAGLDSDTYQHDVSQVSPGATEAAGAAAQQLVASLGAVPWGAVLGGSGSGAVGSGDGAAAAAAVAATSSRQPVGVWATAHAGTELLFGSIQLPPHALGGNSGKARESSSGLPGSPRGVAATGAGTAAKDAAGVGAGTTFVCTVSSGALRQPQLLAALLARATDVGLVLRGLQVVYPGEDAAAALVSSTPHRPLPYKATAVLALYGHSEAVRRWQGQLGPTDVDVRLAAVTDPNSLHSLYGDVAQHITCSYNAKTAEREVSALFQPDSAGQGSGPLLGSNASTPAHVAGLASCSPVQQWLALPAAVAREQVIALWSLQHLLWCGYSLRGMLLGSLPGPAEGGGSCSTAGLVVEVAKEEAAEQLPRLLSALPAPPSAPAAHDSRCRGGSAGASSAPVVAVQSLLPSDTLRSHLLPSDMHGLPQAFVADQLLSSCAAVAASRAALNAADGPADANRPVNASTWDRDGTEVTRLLHHGEDGLVAVALQARPLHAAALALCAVVASSCSASSGSSSGRLELVACRYLKQVPSAVSQQLAAVQLASPHLPGTAAPGGSAGAHGRSFGAQRLVISQPALLAVFHGPDAQSRMVELLQSALQRVHGQAPPSGGSLAAAANGLHSGPAGAPFDTLLDQLLRQYPTAVSSGSSSSTERTSSSGVPASSGDGGRAPLPLLAATSPSLHAAQQVLAYAFSARQVRLDPSMHDGQQRPPLTAHNTAGSGSRGQVHNLARLLSGPEPLSTIVGVDLAAVHRNLLPRLLKQLCREGYGLHAATTCLLKPGTAAAAAMPQLSGRPAVLLLVSRSNALQHLQHLAAMLASSSAATRSGMGAEAASAAATVTGICAAASWYAAAAAAEELWPCTDRRSGGVASAASAEDAAVRGAAGAGSRVLGLGSATAAKPERAPARRFVRPEGSRLLQVTTMVVTPGKPPDAGGALTSLPWVRLAEALEALHTEGFRLAALRAAAATPLDLSDVARLCRLSPMQQHAVASAAAASAAALASGSAAAAAAGLDPSPSLPELPPCNMALVALARDNAVTSLQMLMDEAGRSAGSGQGHMGQLRVGAGLAGREAVTALASIAAAASVSHSPAAAEQQCVAMFKDGVFGVGGVELVGPAGV